MKKTKDKTFEEFEAEWEAERKTFKGKLLPLKWKFENLIEMPGNWYREIKYFIQRGRRGYSDRDTWGIDYFLVDVLPPMLKNLQKNKHGIPAEFAGKTKKDFKVGQKKWDATLQTMLDGFESAHKLLETDFDIKNKKAQKNLYKEFDAGMKIFSKYFFNLWD